MEKLQKIEEVIKQGNDVEEVAELLFWMDCYIVDDGQWILDTNRGKIYGHSLPYYCTILDLMGYENFSLYHETDQELIAELETF